VAEREDNRPGTAARRRPASRLDALVVGSGVAGLSSAVALARHDGARVGVLTKGVLEQSATRWAQGGVAAVLSTDEDSTDLHLADTLRAGAGMCDHAAVRVLVEEGPARVHELIALGAVFDRTASGQFALAREGGHSMARVVHAGGTATGAEVERALVAAVCESAAARYEHCFALDLMIEQGRCVGVRAVDEAGELLEVRADHVLLSTGGAGQLFSVTTNPAEATGDGVAMALRAGLAVCDLEFVQFHPTALHHPAMPRPLLSEALRGHGALLRDRDGARFVDELAPRDVVSRAMAQRMTELGAEHCFLDATGLEEFGSRFPTIAAALREASLDPARDWLPVAPAAHYLCGGILTDLDGATTLRGCWAAGEVAATGVHGANRLASNSLLEGMVFGARVVEAIRSGRDGPQPTGAMAGLLGADARLSAGEESRHISDRLRSPRNSRATPLAVRLRGPSPGPLPTRAPGAGTLAQGSASEGRSAVASRSTSLAELERARADLEAAFSAHAGVVRSAASLRAVEAALGEVAARIGVRGPTASPGPVFAARSSQTGRAHDELVNLMEVGAALVAAAAEREESRGAHFRSDHPESDEAFRYRIGFAGGGSETGHG
jgi:L-aspartate oxidase